MRTTTISTYLAILMFLTIVIHGCSQSEGIQPDLEPQKAILGRWELVETGWHGDMSSYPSTGYVEYLPDSVLRVYDYEENRITSESKYWLKDSILYNGVYEDGVFHGVQKKYHFFENNDKLRLEYYNSLPIVPISIYKRIQ